MIQAILTLKEWIIETLRATDLAADQKLRIPAVLQYAAELARKRVVPLPAA